MAYYIDLFSPETYQAFKDSDKFISGFRKRQENIAAKMKPGDKLICYVTRLSRWFGILEVKSNYFEDSTPIFMTKEDPFCIRFKVKELVWLNFKNSLPIKEDIIWKNLSFTKNLPKTSQKWTMMVRGSLNKLSDADGKYLERVLFEQNIAKKVYEFDPKLIEKAKIVREKTKKVKERKKIKEPSRKNEFEVSGKEINIKNISDKKLHNEVRDKIKDIGNWLGFTADIEKRVADGSKVDTIWEQTIGNMGRVIYVFEVQTKGSIDSLCMNLLKSLNNNAVQGIVAVSDAKQIEKIRKHASGVQGLKDKLKYWDYIEVLRVWENLEYINISINKLDLVPKGF